MSILSLCRSVHHIYVWCLCGQMGVDSPRTGVTDACEPSCECWKENSGPLEEHPVFLTPQPSLHSRKFYF